MQRQMKVGKGMKEEGDKGFQEFRAGQKRVPKKPILGKRTLVASKTLVSYD